MAKEQHIDAGVGTCIGMWTAGRGLMTQDRNGYLRLQMMCTLPSAVALQSFLVMIPLGQWVQIICHSLPLSVTLPLLHRVTVWELILFVVLWRVARKPWHLLADIVPLRPSSTWRIFVLFFLFDILSLFFSCSFSCNVILLHIFWHYENLVFFVKYYEYFYERTASAVKMFPFKF
jgi:hypothetical protein